jgi:enoyl-CoA hydratase
VLKWSGRVAVLTLDRPEKRNALTIELCERVRDATRESVGGGARAVVITGAGSSFCSGADLDGVYSHAFREALYDMLRTVVDAPVPVLAHVNGPAIGAGTQLAIAADLRVVAPSAVFAIRRLSLLAGNGTARSLLLACSTLSASEALARGVADRAGSLDETLEWAESMVELAPLTVAYNKLALNAVFEPDFAVVPGAEATKELTDAFEGCWSSEDFAEGRLAREEKRKPRFQGR